MPQPISGQLGTAQLGLFGLGDPGLTSLRPANAFAPDLIEGTETQLAVRVNQRQGPIFYNNRIYCTADDFSNEFNTNHLGVFRRNRLANVSPLYSQAIDRWAPLDVSHEPPITSITCTFYNKGDSKVRVATQLSTKVLRITAFDLATELFEAPLPTFTFGFFLDNNQFCPVLLPNGDIVLVYTYITTTDISIRAIVLSGGTWGSPVVLVTKTPNSSDLRLLNVAVDSSNRVHTVYYDQFFPFVAKAAFLSGGAWSSPVTITGAQSGTLGPGIYLPIADKIVFPSNRFADSGGFHNVGMLVGTPSSAPVWSLVDVAQENDSLGLVWADYNTESKLYIIWDSLNNGVTPNEGTIKYSLNLAPPVTFYDSITDPYPVSGFPGEVAMVGATVTADRLATQTGMNATVGNTGDWCGLQFYIARPFTSTTAKKFIPQYTKNAAHGNN